MQQPIDKVWDYALGLATIDGGVPEPEFMEIVQRNIRGEVSDAEVERWIKERYTVKE